MHFDDFGGDDAQREPSVIIDLNAKAAEAEREHRRKGQATPVPIHTSEQGATASGVFVMPTAAAPMAQRVEPRANASADPDGWSTGTDVEMALPLEPPPSTATPAAKPAPASTARAASAPSADAAKSGPTASAAAKSAPTASAAAKSAPASATSVQAPKPATNDSAPRRDSPPANVASASPYPAASQYPAASYTAHAPSRADESAPRALDVADSEPIARRSLLATVLPTPRARQLAIIGGVAAAFLIVLVVVLTGGKHASAPTTASPKPARSEPAKPAVVAATTPPPATSPAVTPPATTPTTAQPPTTRPTAPVQRAPRIARSNKPVVVDYDKTKAPPSPADHDASLERARTAYATGNHHLFAGETDAAIAAYKQALAVYPNYVAGYRGLGLAYAQLGNSPAALKAFKTYVGLAPTAKDVELIKKRIARLSAK